MNNKFNTEQAVRFALHPFSFTRSETKEILDNLRDLEELAAAKRTLYKPRAAIFI